MKGGERRGPQQKDSDNIFISPIAWYSCKDGVNSNQLTELEFQPESFLDDSELEFQPESFLDDSELELLSLSFCFMQLDQMGSSPKHLLEDYWTFNELVQNCALQSSDDSQL